MDEKLDIREKGGVRNGEPQVSDRRLFMQLLAFGDAENTSTLVRALEAARLPAVLYVDANDPHGVGLLTWSDNPEFFVGQLREFLKRPASVRPDRRNLGTLTEVDRKCHPRFLKTGRLCHLERS